MTVGGTAWADPVTRRDDGLVDWTCAVCGRVNEAVEPTGGVDCGGDCAGGFDFDFYTPPPVYTPTVVDATDPLPQGDCLGCTEAENREFEARYPELFEIDRDFRLERAPVDDPQ